jgi:hypothetical protein
MMRAGDPTQATEWVERVRGLGRNLAAAAAELRSMIATVPAAWSDGPGSSRMIADLTAVAGHLQLLADLLAGRPASSAGLISEAASWLAAAQAAADAASAPGTGPAESFGTWRRDIALGRMDGQIVLLDAARLAAGERATLLDDRYRTALARLTAPPQPSRAVLDAGGAVAPTDHAGPTTDTAPGTATNPGIGIGADPAIGANPGVGPGAMSGGAADWRQTWFVEDRDLYATGPSVQPVIGGG